MVGNPTLEWDVIGPKGGGRSGPLSPTDHWHYLRGTLDEMFGAFGTQVTATGQWNVTLMEASFDAIINETTAFTNGIDGGKQMVLIRGYPGPLGVPFVQLPSSVPGDDPQAPNKTITLPTWPAGNLSTSALATARPEETSVAQMWLHATADDAVGNEATATTVTESKSRQCGILQGYFE